MGIGYALIHAQGNTGTNVTGVGNGSGSSFPVTTAVTVNSGGSIYPAGTGVVSASAASSGSPSSTATFFPATSTACTLAVYSATGTNFCMVNGITGAVTTNTDFRALWDAAVAAFPTGGHFYFKQGTYNCNTLDTEATGGYTNSYCMGFPANTGSAGNYAEWVIEGESTINAIENLPSLQTTGTIFAVTSAAVGTVAGTQPIMLMWARPDTTNHIGSQVRLKNFTVRFPVNTRCYEYGVNVWEAMDIDIDNAAADFASTAWTTTVAPCSLANALVGFTGTKSTRNLQHFSHLAEFGYYVGYQFESEHTVFERSFAGYNTYPITYGDATPFAIFNIFDQSVWTEITTIQSINGPLLGANLQLGSSLIVHGLNCEILTTGNYAGSCLWTETQANYTSGQIYETFVNATAGTALAPVPIPLFSSNGGLFEVQDSASASNFVRLPAQDTFLRSSGAIGLGPMWVNTILGTPCGMISNTGTATVSSGSASCVYAAQVSTTAQDVKATISTVDANGLGIIARGAELSDNSYSYVCTSNAGRILRKRLAGVPTSIATVASNCAGGGVMELEVIPIGGTNYLYTWYNGVADLSGTEATLTPAGFTGIIIGGTGDSLTNFSGGSLPAFDALRAANAQPAFHTAYNTVTKCAGVGTAASPSIVTCGANPAGVFSCGVGAETVCTVNTTAMTSANSTVVVVQDSAATTGTLLGVTCNVTVNAPEITAKVAVTSFSITIATPAVNPACFDYWIVN